MHKNEFRGRRSTVLKQMARNSLAIIPAAPIKQRNNDVEHSYRQDSDFLYLTGFAEPEAVAILKPGCPDGEFILFCRERDPKLELWNGRRAGLEGAERDFAVDKAFPIAELDKRLPKLLEQSDKVYFSLGSHPELDQKLPGWLKQIRQHSRSGASGPDAIVALDPLLHKMRQRKSRQEIEAMRRSAEIAAEGHQRMMRQCKPGLYEYQLEAEFRHHCMHHGAREQAYPPIIGGGDNACILHYTENSARLKDGDLVLIDAGCEFGGYASDITRTFPVNGRFSPEQKALYEWVLAAHTAAIKKVQPGNRFDEPHEAALKVLTQGLIDLGILKGKLSKQIKKKGYQKYFMHKTSHWLGMDVHDVGPYKKDDQWLKLKPGMVLTIEPGLYIPQGDSAHKRWRGIGIRIEDDLLVTAKGHENLTRMTPTTVDEIEGVMRP